ncbi:MAG: hypothetical protein LBR74_10380 [Eubacterium sp.]|jgi:hypothetical protein|nr:hypothetical protein [Eubacterium sp.]
MNISYQLKMKNSIISFALAILTLTFTFSTSAEQNVFGRQSQLPAFPGAEGGGKYVTGGRGKPIYIVDSLLDYDPKIEEPIKGTLRDALSEDDRTIVFNISGVIELKNTLRIDKKNITIAGQTAPGDGITIYGYETNISNAENLIIRYIRFRTGSKNVHKGDSKDAIWGRSMKNVMIDHISASWSTDEALSLYRAENMTVQWSIISESLAMSGHTKGRHGYGGIWGGVNTTFHHNLVASHTSRNPRMGGGTPVADDNKHIANFDIRNNVIYNWGFNTAYGGGRADVNYMYNYMKPGPATKSEVKNRLIDLGESGKPGRFYVNDNILEGSPEITADNSKGIYISEANRVGTQIMRRPFRMDGTLESNLNTESADEAYKSVLAKSGAVLPRRDAIDSRVVAEVKNKLGNIVNTEHETGGLAYTQSVSRPIDFDVDKDGMWDYWEIKNNLDPNDPYDGNNIETNYLNTPAYNETLNTEGIPDYWQHKNAVDQDSGKRYTNLEIYLNELADMDFQPKNPEISIVKPTNNQSFKIGESVSVTANARAGGNGVKKVEYYLGSEKIGESFGRIGNFSIKLDGLKDGTFYLNAKATDFNDNQTHASPVVFHVNSSDTTSQKWKSADIGKVPIEGTTSYKDNKITIKGSGKIYGAEDSFRYNYLPATGDYDIAVKVDSITPVDHHAFAGIMMRENLSPSSKAVVLGVSYTKAYEWTEKNEKTGASASYYRNPFGAYLAARTKTSANFDTLEEQLDSYDNAAKTDIILKKDIPMKDAEGEKYIGYHLRLIRQGDVFKSYLSADGQKWMKLGERELQMDESIYIGLAVDSNQQRNDLHNLNTAVFSNVVTTDDSKAVKLLPEVAEEEIS